MKEQDLARLESNINLIKEGVSSNREALEQLKVAVKCDNQDKAALARWLHAVLTPQTIAIILAIAAAALGAPMISSQIMGTTGLPTAVSAPAEAEVAEAPAAEEAPEEAPAEETPAEEAVPE